MQLTPRYGDDPVLRIETAIGDVGTPLLRQRARLAKVLEQLDDAQWAAPSRCEGWSVQDVVAHLVTTNEFWAFSITAGLAGSPTTVLATFDPVATPAAMVDAGRGAAPSETLERFGATNDALAAVVGDIDERGWSTIAEAPPGHIAVRAVALHALWDAWVHERDVVLPLGLGTVDEADEIVGCLQYAAALGPAFHASRGSTRTGALRVRTAGPAAAFVVDVGPTVVVRDGDAPEGATVLDGPTIDLLEALSYRAPLAVDVPDDERWLFDGLGEVFDQA
jgi:uncharacterized protein (TIGR03083 family)